MPRVAIITRTKDRPLLLERASNSVLSQSYKDYYWVVINDGGEQIKARNIVDQCSVDKERIIFINNENTRGMEAASNTGIRSIKSDYVVIHDDDDTWSPEFLQKTIEFLESSKGKRYGGVITHSYYISEEILDNGIIEHDRIPYNDWIKNVQLCEMAAGNIYPPISFVYRRKIWEKIGGYNEDLPVLGDWYFNLEFLLHSDIGVIPEPLSYYHHRDLNADGTDIYSNSVIASVDVHDEYNAIIRNEFIRDNIERYPIALALIQGYAINDFRVNRGKVNTNLKNKFDNDLLNDADRYWLAAQVNYLIASSKTWLGTRKWKVGSLVKPDFDLDTMLDIVQGMHIHINPPPGFDEDLYLKDNPDVAVAIDNGTINNGYMHYLIYGRSEGRERPYKKQQNTPKQIRNKE